MQFETYSPAPPLDGFIESIFHFKNFIPDHSIERVVPTGHVFLIFELDGYPRYTYNNETLKPDKTFRKAWISGAHTRYLSISAHENSEMFVIQFRPFGAYPFLHFPVADITDKVLSAEIVLGADIPEIREQILIAESPGEKFKMAESWLEKRFDATRQPPQEMRGTIDRLKAEPGFDHSAIIKNYSSSQKHLIDQFKKYTGLTPKQFQRILRFNEILQRIQKNESISWTDIAYQGGFSDQSHFIKEFRHFSGFNPQEFIRNDYHLDEPNFFPLDKKG